MPRQQRRRALSALITIAFSLVILVAPLVAMAVAQNQPSIKIWNPSDYNETENESPMIVSDRRADADEEDDLKEATYRLMATSQNTPNPALVEFELVISTVSTITIGTATQAGPDAWELHWDIPPTVVDGPYTLRAILYAGSGITATEVDRDEAPVVIRTGHPAADAAAETLDINYPLNGSEAGFYTNPENGVTSTRVEVEFSSGTTYIELFYTTSDPGDEPEWKSCFFEDVAFTGEAPAQKFPMRCTLEPQDQGGLSVTGLAAVPNNSPSDPAFSAEYDPNLDQAGDAVRVFPYKQDATSVTVDDPELRHEGTGTSCTAPIFVTIRDQNGELISGINMDVHARGPSDQLNFRVPGTPLFQRPPSAVKAPDKAHSGLESAYACGSPTQNFATIRQGDHNVPGGPDVKHIESSTSEQRGERANTNQGRFGISLNSPDANGGSQITFWADEDGDDQFCDDEPFAVASVGFNVPAPPATGETPVLSECPIPAPPPPGGTESPTDPDPTNTNGEEPDDCTHRGTSGDDSIVGSQGNDIICAGAGDDSVDGRGGDDIIRGEDGNDQIIGGLGDDTIDGGAGDDRVDSGTENDVIDGRGGVDVVNAGPGDDTIRGQKDVDGLQGSSGNDLIQSGRGDDVVDAQGGKDVLRGFDGQDILRGGGGGDIIRGMNANDQLTGGGGNDKLHGGNGRDQCSGGGGRDKVQRCENKR